MKMHMIWMTAAVSLLSGGTARAGYQFTKLQDPNDNIGFTLAAGINNSGMIVGSYNQNQDAFTYSISGGTYTTIDNPGAMRTVATGINDSGIIVGYTQDSAANLSGYTLQGTAFSLFTDPSGNKNPNLTAPTTGSGINNSGTVVGFYLNNSSKSVGFSRSGGTFTDINVFGSTFTAASGINNAGMIVGSFNDSTGTHGFVDNNTTFSALDAPGAVATFATGINTAGDIVGYYVDTIGNSHGFIDKGGVFVTVDDPNGIGTTLILGVNDMGDIVGQYTENGVTSGFLGAAISEPSTFALFSLPILGLAIRRRLLYRD